MLSDKKFTDITGQKKSSYRNTKRTTKPEEDNWVCGVCTFHCTAEDMKCIACDARKGTSTR
uniref:RanBP2-type domain-containing protein n=1 Tax=Eptatretus burgeri TaxID=7764 RepID=A0A8C4Q0Y4_EPTBU